jgi:hypothetical protein
VVTDGVYQGADTILDFKIGEDKLDVYEITKKVRTDKFDLFKFEQTDVGTMVYVQLPDGLGMQAIAMMDGLKATDLQATMKDWLIV